MVIEMEAYSNDSNLQNMVGKSTPIHKHLHK